MIAEGDRQRAIELVAEAVSCGARRDKACAVLEIDVRTLQRCRRAQQTRQSVVDQRKASGANRTPANKLNEIERVRIQEVSNTAENQSLAPSQIVPKLADEGIYIASESPLAGATELGYLEASFNHIESVEPLSGSWVLRTALFFDNEITNISPLASIVFLFTLDIEENPIDENEVTEANCPSSALSPAVKAYCESRL